MKRSFVNGLTWLACLLGPVVSPVAAMAQEVPRAVSPASPMDLTKPQFDTQTPHYDVSGAAAKAATTVVADVGGRVITLGEVGDTIRALPLTAQSLPFETVYPSVLKQLTQVQALVIRAERHGLDKDPAVIRRAKAAADNVMANAVLVREAGGAITEKTLLDRYERDYAGKPGPEEVDVSVILVATETEARAILAELAGGADFAAIARRSSRDNSSSAGGHLGFVREEIMAPELGSVAFELAPGQTVKHPIRTGIGWFVVRAGERRRGPQPPFAEVREDIRITLLREAFPAITEAAMSDVTVHTFDISGKDVQTDEPKQP